MSGTSKTILLTNNDIASSDIAILYIATPEIHAIRTTP